MYYIVESAKSFEQAAAELDAAIWRHGFGVLQVHDLGATLRSKGLAFAEECRVYEVCNPAQAAKVMTTDMRLNMALPCRISVYTEQGKTYIGMVSPVAMLAALSPNPALQQVAGEVEAATRLMIDEAR